MRNKIMTALLVAAIPVAVFAQSSMQSKHRGHGNMADNSSSWNNSSSGDASSNGSMSSDAMSNGTDPTAPR